jgi:carbonic anhydrase
MPPRAAGFVGPKEIAMRLQVLVSVALVVACAAGGCKREEPGNAAVDAPRAPAVQTKEKQAAMTPAEALALLREGNERFVAGQSKIRNLPAKVAATAAGQYPFAVILSCLDSRQSVELLFDQGIGDVFNARVAGNVLNDDVLGSLEFACKVSGARLILVLGHSNCGAIKGAIDGVELGHLTGLLDRIKPAIAAVPASVGNRDSKNAEFIQQVADSNVRLVMKQIRERSPILKEMLDGKSIGLSGGMYDLSTGRVSFVSE